MDRSGIDHAHYPIQLRRAIAALLPTRGLALMANARWTDRLLVMVLLLLAWSPQTTLQDRFAEARHSVVHMYRSRRRPGKTFAGFMRAVRQNSGRLLELIAVHLRRQMAGSLDAQWRVGRWQVFGVDGTKIDCPRTIANERRFNIGGRHKSGPQMLLVSLIHLGSGLVWAWRQGDARGSERGLLREMLGDLPAGALLVADAGFVGYELLQTILAAGHSLLIRAGANVTLLEKLGYSVQEKQGIVYLWPHRAQKQAMPPVALRLITLTDGRNRKMCLLTACTKTQMSDREAMALYARRWQAELLYRGLKQTLSRRKMLSDSPAHAQVELDWTMMGLWMLAMMQRQEQDGRTLVHQTLAGALRCVRGAIAGRGDRRSALLGKLRSNQVDCYRRLQPKKARDWPHKKNDPPCGTPKLRTAEPPEVQLAKRLREERRAA